MDVATTACVSHEAGRLLTAVVAAPDAGFERAKPIFGEGPPFAARARMEHEVFVRTLKRNRVDVVELEPDERFALSTLVRSTAIALPGGVVMARLVEGERRGEEEAVKALLERRGVRVLGAVEGPGMFDARDAVVMGNRLVAARTGATNAAAIEQLAAFAQPFGLEIREARLAPGVSHLGDVFSPVDAEAVVAAPDLVSGAAMQGVEVVALAREMWLAAGCLALAPRHVVMDVRMPTACAVLKRAKIFVDAIDLYDFGRAGAGPWALALPLHRAALR